MYKRCLSYLLLIAIALQSLFAVASQQQLHQIDLEHLKIEHSHQTDSVSVKPDNTLSTHNIEDCHHCGHCHGSHSVNWVASHSQFALDQREYSKQLSLQSVCLRPFSDELLRPPILS